MPNIDYTLRLRDLFSGKLKNAVAQTKKADAAVGKLGGTLKTLGKTVGKAGLIGVAVGGLVALGAATIKFADGSLEALKRYEFFSITLRTLMKGNANAAKALQGQLTTLAKTTPFSLADVQKGATQLLASGARGGDVIRELTMLGDVAAGVNVPIERLIVNFGQVRARGKLLGTELRDFTRASVPLGPALVKVFNSVSGAVKVTEKDIDKMASEGKISFAQMKQAFALLTSQGGLFADLMKKQSKTVGGVISNLGDAWEQLQLQAGRSQRGMIFSVTSWAERTVSSLEESLRAVNDLEEALVNFKAPQVSKGPLDFLIGGVGTDRQDFLLNQLKAGDRQLKNTSKTEKTAQGQKILFEKQLANLKAQFAKDDLERIRRLEKAATFKGRGRSRAQEQATRGLLSETGFKQQSAVLLRLIGLAQGNIDLFAPGKKPPGAGGLDEGLGTGVGISGRRPQNINITINKLVETLEIHSENLTEGVDEAQDMVSKGLLEAVNDVNSISR